VTIPVLIILGALWAAVLVPPLLRAHSDSKSTSIGELSNKLGVLNKNRSSIKLKTNTYSTLVPHQPQVKALTKNAASAKRRKEILLALVIASFVTLALAFFTSSSGLWTLNVVLDICLGAYIFMLFKLEQARKLKLHSSRTVGKNNSNIF